LNFNHFRLIFGTKKKQKFFGLYNQKQAELSYSIMILIMKGQPSHKKVNIS